MARMAPLGGLDRASWSGRVLALAGVLVVAGLIGGAGLTLWDQRARALAEHRRTISTLGVALAEQTERSLQAVDLVLRDLTRRLTEAGVRDRDGLHAVAGTRATHELLKERLFGLPQADDLPIMDADGRPVNFASAWPGPSIDVRDRDYFVHLQGHDDPGIFVGAPVQSRGTGTWVVPFVRRVNDPQGRFLGVVMATLKLRYFEEFYAAVTPRGGSVALLRADGTVLASHPSSPGRTGSKPPHDPAWRRLVQDGGGAYRAERYFDGQPHLVSAHALRGGGLVVEVGVAESAALAAWRRHAALVMLGVATAAGCLLLLLHVVLRQLRDLRRSADALRHSEQCVAEKSATLETTLERIDQGIMMVNADRVVAVCNQRAVEMLGLPAELMARRPRFEEVLAFQWNTDEFAFTEDSVKDFVRAGGILDQPHVYERCRPNGRSIEVRSQPLPGGGVVRTYTDITDRKAAEDRVRYVAHHDDLTRLANRVVLQDRLAQAVATAERGGGGLALLYLDLDRFKPVNDTRGHETGDKLLAAVAERMRAGVRACDLVARMGGDEFAIVQPQADQPAAVALAERLVAGMAEPFEIDGECLTIGVSIGVAIYPGAGTTPDQLRRNADMALYRAKRDGRNTFRVFEPATDSGQRECFALEQDLRDAVLHERLDLAYQPMVDAHSGAVLGFEALLRWTHPRHGPIAPGAFVPLAEASGLIQPLGRWVLETACREAAAWPARVHLSVNLSPLQVREPGLCEVVADVLRRAGLDPARLHLEVTEGHFLEDTGPVLETMRGLHALGVGITLDDFGTGHASLSYLRRFPFDRLKIDQSFVRGLDAGQGARAIVEAVLQLGKSLNLAVVAEGVETVVQLDALRAMGCHRVQGYLTGRPMTAQDARRLVSTPTPEECEPATA